MFKLQQAEPNAYPPFFFRGLVKMGIDLETQQRLVQLSMIEEKSTEVQEKKNRYLHARDQSLARKKEMDEAVTELMDLIAQGPPKPDPQMRLDFGDDTVTESTGLVAVKGSIDLIDIPAKEIEKLRKAGIKTLAELDEVINGENKQYVALENVPGINAAAAERIVSARRHFQEGGTPDVPTTTFEDGEGDTSAPLPEVAVSAAPSDAEPKGNRKARIKVETDGFTVGEVYSGRLIGDTFLAMTEGSSPQSFEVGEYELV